jgi:hypothetical protein
MTHWYREPKQVKLIEHLERAGIGFVLSSDQFSESDLLNLRAILHAPPFSEKFSRGVFTEGDPQRVLIVAPEERPDPLWLQNPEPWAGVFILPAIRSHREQALHGLFTMNRSFHNGARGRRAISKGVLHRFILDMRSHPPSLYGVRGGQSDRLFRQE